MSDATINKLAKRDSNRHWRTLKYRKIYTTILYIFSALVISLFPQFGSIVKATSVHDDSFVTTTDVDLKNQYCGPGGTNDMQLELDDVITAVLNNGTYGSSFATAIESGRIGVTNFTQHEGPDPITGLYKNSLHVFWTTDTSLYLDWYAPYKAIYAHGSSSTLTSIFIDAVNSSGTCVLRISSSGMSNLGVVSTALAYGAVKSVILETDYPGYPSSYEGPSVISAASLDEDTDGLHWTSELAQGTLDSDPDTDDDGISDLKESIWFTDRDEVFCGTSACAYPSPTTKDIYVEIDWMVKDSTPLLPTSTQLGAVVSAFGAQNILLHFDTGQYGGGEEVAYVEELKFLPDVGLDFFDYKRGGDGIGSSFDPDRYGIWRYMISGDTFDDGEPLDVYSGVSLPGDDDIFISYDGLKNDNTAVSGTIMHELGHVLCLTPVSWYSGQDESCVFAGVHSYIHEYYESSMSYEKQKTIVDFSDKSSPVGDHNDWAAIMLGMNDFVEINDTDPSEPTFGVKIAQINPRPTHEEASIYELTKQANEERPATNKESTRSEAISSKVSQVSDGGDENNIASTKSAMNNQNMPAVSDHFLMIYIGMIALVFSGVVAWNLRRRNDE